MIARIFIPLGPSGGARGDDSELRFTLRSIAQNWRGPMPEITILGTPPAWSKGLRHIPRRVGEKNRESAAAHGGAIPFLWWYDDCLLVSPSTVEDFFLPRRAGDLAKALAGNQRGNPWAQSLARVTEELLATGRSTHNFSGPHAPTFYTAADLADSLAYWAGKWARNLPLESWINNDGRLNRDASDVETRFVRSVTTRPPAPGTRLLVFNDAGVVSLWPWIEATFSTPSPWEK